MTPTNEAGSAPRGAAGPVPRPGRSVRARLAADVAVAFLPMLAAATATSRLLDLTTSHIALCFAVYAGLAGMLWRHAPADLPTPGIGWANRVTLFRAALSVPIVALVFDPGVVPAGGRWWIIALAGTALALDGLDGAVARRTTTGTAFGARFDMEVDALLILVLALLVWTSTPLGIWVVGIGALRYLFVAAAYPWPVLSGSLPPSLRRKVVCVVQSVALLICLAPPVSPPLRSGTALLALGLLLYSFAVDVRWLRTHAPDPRVP